MSIHRFLAAMAESINRAKGAVEKALARVNLNSLEWPSYRRDDELLMMELAVELTWMKCFLINSERTNHGRTVAPVWCPAIERLAGSWVHSLLNNSYVASNSLGDLCKQFASLRQKIQPFVITCQCHGSSPSSSPVS
ncbi:unnamed protein product [Cuscuta europaea]|uniref:Uncharacterized protein n=1 Tax=Cuscuta europaea TaxID=41803 RepID=A0A9P0ZM47_CUSEU|nr:unnamed protein product [Cuscuta europaea]